MTRTVAKNGPHPTDVHVGRRVREARMIRGMSQETLGKALGITFQQVQKNERGRNRIGASRLYQLSQVLGVPVDYFYRGLNGKNAGKKGGDLKREDMEMVRAVAKLPPAARRQFRAFVSTLARGAGA